MFDKFPTKINEENNYSIIFDVDLHNDEEQKLFFQSLLVKDKNKENTFNQKKIIMRDNNERDN